MSLNSPPDADGLVMRHGLEDANEKELLDRAAPLAASLTPGINYFSPKLFRDLAYFMLEGKAISTALEAGQFVVMRLIRVVRVHESNMLTLSELSRITGVPQRTLWDMAARLKLSFKKIGNRKLYNIQEIKANLAERR